MSTRRVTSRRADVNPPITQSSPPATTPLASKRASGQSCPVVHEKDPVAPPAAQTSEALGTADEQPTPIAARANTNVRAPIDCFTRSRRGILSRTSLLHERLADQDAYWTFADLTTQPLFVQMLHVEP